MPFLQEDYVKPKTESNYFRFKDGENTFRVMSDAITGWEYWTKENKPVRAKDSWEKIPQDAKDDFKQKHFWAFVVWNVDAKKIQILEITQSTIQDAMQALNNNPKWGDPKTYDITVTRTGEMLETEYQVMPNPHAEVEEDAKVLYKESNIDIEALFVGGDPFDNGR